MYKVIIFNDASEKIDIFIEKYLDSFLSLFVDSWISNLYFIEENYRKTAENFRNEIYEKIKIVFKNKILPKKVWIDWELSIIISV